MKKSLLGFKVSKLVQTLEECNRSIADLHKAVYIVTKYNHFRTQFTTMEESKDERKIISYQNNLSKIMKALCESIIFKIATNNLENNQKMILSNISKVILIFFSENIDKFRMFKE